MPNSKPVGVAYADPLFDSVAVGSSANPVSISSTGITAGTSANPFTNTASGSLNSTYVSTSHASGDVRLRYEKMTFTSTGTGETLRAFSVVTAAGTAVGGTVNGAHISTSINGSGTISGAANALRATIGGTSTNPGGTLAALQLDSDFATGGTWTNASFLRCTDSGTGAIGTFAVLPTAMVASKGGSTAVSHVIPIKTAAGTTYYLMVSTNA